MLPCSWKRLDDFAAYTSWERLSSYWICISYWAPAICHVLAKMPQWNFNLTRNVLIYANCRVQLYQDSYHLPRFNWVRSTAWFAKINWEDRVRNTCGGEKRARIYGGSTKGNTHSCSLAWALCDSIGVRHASFWCAFYTPPSVYDQFPSAQADCIFMCTAKEQKKV